MAITTHSGKIIEGVAPPQDVELGNRVNASLLEGAKNPEVEDGYVIMNEKGNTLGIPWNDNIAKVEDDSIKSKSVPPKNFPSSSKSKAHQ